MACGAEGVVRHLLVVVAALALLGACASTQPLRAPEQPALAALAMPYAPDLRALGITRLVSPGGGALVRLETAWGAVYVPFPRDVPPVAFELEIDEGGVRAAADAFDARTRRPRTRIADAGRLSRDCEQQHDAVVARQPLEIDERAGQGRH